MKEYTYVTTSYGEGETHASLEDATKWIAEYIMTEKARCFSPKLWILNKDGDMIGNIYLAGKDAKIMIGENNTLVIDACMMLRNSILERHTAVI